MDIPLLAEWTLFCERRTEFGFGVFLFFVFFFFFSMTVLNVGATKGMLDNRKQLTENTEN